MRTRDAHELLFYLRWLGRPAIYAVRQHCLSAAEKKSKQAVWNTKENK